MRKSVRDFRFGPLLPHCSCNAELLFEVFSQRYECGSTMVTSNLPPSRNGRQCSSQSASPGALLDRLAHHVHSLELNGDSYRLKHSASRKRTVAGAEQNKASTDSRPAD